MPFNPAKRNMPSHWKHKKDWYKRRGGLRRRLTFAFAFVALAAVALTTWLTLGAVFNAQQELFNMTEFPNNSSNPDRMNHPSFLAAKEAFTQVTRTAFLAGFVAFFMASFAAAAVTRLLTRPLKALTEGAKRLEAGERNLKLELPKSRDELRGLTEAFNSLGESLETQEAWRRNTVADIAHDLRTPLAVMRSEIEGMQDGIVKLDEAGLDRLHGEVMLLTRLVSDLRTLSLVESGGVKLHKQDVRLKDWLERLTASFQLRAHELGSSITLDVYSETLKASLDSEQMTRVFSNLLDNALRYASPSEITVSARNAENGVKLSVQDKGAGLPQETLEQVFERFYRGDRSRTSRKEGSGLGLAIAKAIVEAHGGKLEAQNALAGGAVFTIYLPNE